MGRHIEGGRKAKTTKGTPVGNGDKTSHGDKHVRYHTRRAENRRRGILTAKERRAKTHMETA